MFELSFYLHKLSNLNRSPKITLFKQPGIALLQNQEWTHSQAKPHSPASQLDQLPWLILVLQPARAPQPQPASQRLFPWPANQIILPGQPARAFFAQPAIQSPFLQLASQRPSAPGWPARAHVPSRPARASFPGQPTRSSHLVSQPEQRTLASQLEHLRCPAGQSLFLQPPSQSSVLYSTGLLWETRS